jgi:hypothetical protein
VDPVPFYTNGNLNFKAHDVGWIVCGFFTLIASTASFWLIWKHLTYYTCPSQQRHIVRMLFMVPIYAIVSLLSYVFYHEAVYYQTIRDCYEAVVIVSFFYLLLQYVGDTPAEQHEVFRAVKLKKWVWPLGYWKYRPSGLHFLWLMKICILQYAIVRPVCTLVAVGLQYFGIYCLESWAPYFGHIYITLAISVSVTVAMYCVIQFYMPIQQELKPYSPILKFLAVKSVVFLTFWQDSFLSLLVYFGAIKQSEYMSAADIQVGINALLETFEMCIFAFLHIKAFTYLIYRPSNHARTTRRWRALLDVLDYRDWWYQMRQSSRYVVSRKAYTIADDIRREKYGHLEKALGRERWSELQREREAAKDEMPTFWRNGCEPTAEDEYEEALTTNEKEYGQFDHEEKSHTEDDWFIRNRAVDPAYDPERDPMSDTPLDEQEGLEERREDHALLPTLPQLDFVPAEDEVKHFRPVASEHTNENEGNAGYDEDEAFVPRKGSRLAKEGSEGYSGAFWRAYRRTDSAHQRVVPSSPPAQETEVSLSNAMQTSGQIATGATKIVSGPKGRPIALQLPAPLSKDRTFDARQVSPADSRPMSTQGRTMSSTRSSQSRIRFSEQRPITRSDARDDPEAEPVSFNGYVVAGGQSLRQVREKERQREEQRRRSAGRPSLSSDQRRSSQQSRRDFDTDNYTSQPYRGSILQRTSEMPQAGHSRLAAQHPYYPPMNQKHHRSSLPARISVPQEARERREGFHFEYIDD